MSDISVLGIFVADISFSGSKIPSVGETILGNKYNVGPGGKGCNQAIAMMKEHFSSLLLETCINDAVAIKDSVSFGQSVLCYKPKSKSAQQYKQLAQEVISRLETRKKSHAA